MGFNSNDKSWYRFLNFLEALTLTLVALPAIIAISIVLLATQGPDIFYRGVRLGKDKKTFTILKFRTLCSRRAKELTRDRPLPRDARIETPLGRILRDSRLDELPQLFNVLRGDMNICGPRPVRPEIAAIESRRIKNYDRRFEVKPGLIGTTQACFGHATSKRIRARMNARLVARPVSVSAEFALLTRIGLAMAAKVGSELARPITKRFPRMALSTRADIWLSDTDGQRLCVVETMEADRLSAPGLPPARSNETLVLCVRLKSGAIRKARLTVSSSGKAGVWSYAPRSEYSEYVVERYALRLVVLQPSVNTRPVEQEDGEQWMAGLSLSRS